MLVIITNILVYVNPNGTKMTSIGARIKEYRLSTGKNQTDFAQSFGISKNTQVNYEKDKTPPPGDYLKLLIEAGADVHYILTGSKVLSMRESEGEYDILNPESRAIETVSLVIDFIKTYDLELDREQIRALMGMVHESGGAIDEVELRNLVVTAYKITGQEVPKLLMEDWNSEREIYSKN